MHDYAPTSDSPKPGWTRNWNNVRELLPLLWDYRGRAGIALGALLLSKLANVGVPLVLKDIVDAMDLPQGEVLTLPLLLLLVYGALRLASSFFNELRDAVFARVRYRAMRRMSERVLRHLHSLSLRYHLERKTGAITRDLERGARSLSSILNYMVFNILPTAVEFVLVAAILFSQYSSHFAFITFITVAVYVAFTVLVTNWRTHYRQSMNRLDSQANTQAVDSLVNYETVKYFGNEALEAHRYDGTLAQWEDYAVKSQTSMSALNFGQGAIIAVGVTFIMIAAARGVVAGEMSLGDLVLVNALMLQLFLPLNFLGIVYRQITYALVDMDRIVKLLNREPEIRDIAGAKPLEISEGRVRFENVSFHYQADRPILRDISFEVPPGKKVAVVGHSGAGKSTLARLLFRFYETTQGRVTIDGQALRDVTQESLRAAVGIVPQDTVLFNDTLYYNLSYARPGADRDEVVRAAQLAHIHDFIVSLPQGYDTVVGERGLKLSGGEKQRVAIARAILKGPRILVFDEATSSLDSKTEQAIQETLREVATRHTTLVIAHRLSTIVDADRILVMDQGRIVEQGSHRELLAQGAIYAQLWAMQLEERDAQ
ncbi:MAG: ABC transporter ATP-binding protein/permease [Chromatiales bacterium]|nr:ABC transporter ATP-binding protein/permease [Chromatiales bacterium]